MSADPPGFSVIVRTNMEGGETDTIDGEDHLIEEHLFVATWSPAGAAARVLVTALDLSRARRMLSCLRLDRLATGRWRRRTA